MIKLSVAENDILRGLCIMYIGLRAKMIKPEFTFQSSIESNALIATELSLLALRSVQPSTALNVVNDDVIKWKIFRATGPLCGELTGDR